jgi:ubiquitin C-terminal hydrolase
LLVDELKAVLDQLNEKSIGVVDSREFVSSVFGGRRLDGQEQDAQEFNQILLSRLSEVLPRVPEKGISLDEDDEPVGFYRRLHPFEGIQKQTIRCLACSAELSMRIDVFNILALPIASSIEPAIDYASAIELLEGYKCGRCKRVNGCGKQTIVIRWPSVLIVYFIRITMDAYGHLRKDNNPIELADPLHDNYKLSAVVEHCGGLASGGHYVAHRRLSGNHWQSISDALSTIHSGLPAMQPYLVLYENSHNL